jgi:hypothetical protein
MSQRDIFYLGERLALRGVALVQSAFDDFDWRAE